MNIGLRAQIHAILFVGKQFEAASNAHIDLPYHCTMRRKGSPPGLTASVPQGSGSKQARVHFEDDNDGSSYLEPLRRASFIQAEMETMLNQQSSNEFEISDIIEASPKPPSFLSKSSPKTPAYVTKKENGESKRPGQTDVANQTDVVVESRKSMTSLETVSQAKRISDLVYLLGRKDGEISRLQNKVQELMNVRSRDTHERESMENHLRDTISQKDIDIERLTSLLSSQSKEKHMDASKILAAQKGLTDGFRQRLQNLEQREAAHISARSRLEQQLAAKDKEMKAILAEYRESEMKRLSNAIETQHTGMENKMREYEDQITALQRSCNMKDIEINRLSENLNEKDAEIARISVTWGARMRAKNSRIEELSSKLDTIQTDVHTRRLTSKHAESSLQGEISRLSAQLKTFKDRELHNVRHAKSQSSLQVQRLIESHNKEMELSKKRCEARIEIAEKRSRELRKELALAANKHAKQLAEERRKWASQTSRSKVTSEQEVQALRKTHERLLQECIENHRNEVRDLETRHNTFLADLHKQQAESDAMNSAKLRDMNQTFLQQLSDVNAMLGSETAKKTEARSEVMRLTSELEVQKQTILELSQRLTKAEKRTSERHGIANEVERKFGSKVKQYKNQIYDMAVLVEELQSRIKKTETSYQVEMATLELEKKELRQSLKQSNDHNQRVIQKIEDYKDEMKRLHAELELRNKESALYNNEHQRLIHETSRYKNEVRKLESIIYGKPRRSTNSGTTRKKTRSNGGRGGGGGGAAKASTGIPLYRSTQFQ